MPRVVDHYAALGVLPNAEDVVIRAAYKALAQRYHPDKFTGDSAEAMRRMQEINAAYAVLSDATARKKYDSDRCVGAEDAESYFKDQQADPSPGTDPLEEAWEFAVEFYPDLAKIADELTAYSWRLAYSFKAHLVESKKFDDRVRISDSIKAQFLATYFGRNSEIQRFAKNLITTGDRKFAFYLNRAVCVLGDGVSPEMVIRKIVRDAQGPNADRFCISYRMETYPLEKAFSYGSRKFWGLSEAISYAVQHHQKIYGSASTFEAENKDKPEDPSEYELPTGTIFFGFCLFVLLVFGSCSR